MKITICGSTKFVKEMNDAKSFLESRGHTVLLPLAAELNQSKEYWVQLKSNDFEKFASIKSERMMGHFDKVKSSDAILVLNYDKDGKKSYIGPNTLMEMGVAFEHGKKIFVLNRPQDSDPCYDEVVSMQPVFLDGSVDNLE